MVHRLLNLFDDKHIQLAEEESSDNLHYEFS